jgi:hypothetical protein
LARQKKIPIALEGLKLIIPLAVLTVVFFLLQWIMAGFVSLADIFLPDHAGIRIKVDNHVKGARGIIAVSP